MKVPAVTNDPFRIELPSRWLGHLFNRVTGLDAISQHYRARPADLDARGFLAYVLDVLGVSLAVNQRENLDLIPRQGPLVVVANHPLGGLEGVALAWLLSEFRPDLQVLTNELLCRIPELSNLFIGVDILSRQAKRRNLSGLRQAHTHLAQGGALLIFPAGMVATYEFRHRAIVDRPWDRLAGQLVQRHRCACVPVHVGGRNSASFYLAGLFHPRLRTALLPRQLLNKQGYRLPLTPGASIPFQELAELGSPQAITEYLRISSEALGSAVDAPAGAEPLRQARFGADQQREQLQRVIDTLNDCRLVEHRDFDVYCAPFQRLGAIMKQIAVSREVTFRMVGEGTGLASDSDQFDGHYLHLFLWDRQACRVAGAYRIGKVDEIVAAQGIRGLYTRSLYRYNQAFIRQLGPAVEMGRSFIHPDYQRRPVALNLLWRGIGAFLTQNPQYHTLFGSVSISRHYKDLTRALIADTLLTHYQADGFRDLVRPITPHRVRGRV